MNNSKKDTNSNMPKFKFNSYWIYAVIFLIIMAVVRDNNLNYLNTFYGAKNQSQKAGKSQQILKQRYLSEGSHGITWVLLGTMVTQKGSRWKTRNCCRFVRSKRRMLHTYTRFAGA